MDILSNLPRDAIDSILMFLPLRDAVRTSVLSKKWRYKWRTLAEVTLDETDLITTEEDSIPLTFKFTNIIHHLLTLHSGPITKCTITIVELETCHIIDNLISFLSRNGIQHLVLDLPEHDPYSLPCTIFTCLQMRHLTLGFCSIPLPPPAFKGFVWLVTLKLSGVIISSKYLETLISHCPLLEHLALLYMDYLKDIEINAPMLRSFDFGGNVASICLRNSPLLAKISLWHHDSSLDERKGDITKFFESFSALELLFLSDCSLKFLAAGRGVVPTRLPFDLNCVRELKLHIDPEDLDVVSCALCLMRSSPCLQYIEIKVICNDCGSDDDESFPAQESLEVNWSSDVTFNRLREVELRIFKDSEFVRQLIKFLLTKSPLLVRMVIDLEESLLKAVKSSANSFQRASPKAEIVYTGLF